MTVALYLIPAPLGGPAADVVPAGTATAVRLLRDFAVENAKSARAYLAALGMPCTMRELSIREIGADAAALLAPLHEGRSLGVISEAGCPAVADPGADLVAAARAAGVRIVPIPGVSAVTAALSVAGVSADRFVFLGFLPRKGKQRKRLLDQATKSEWPVVLYEAPPRLVDLLEDLMAAGAAEDRPVLVARELTKLHEEVRDGGLAEAIAHFQQHPPRGELTIVLWPAPSVQPEAELPDPSGVARKLLGQGMTRRAAAAELVKLTGLPRNEAYRMVLELE